MTTSRLKSVRSTELTKFSKAYDQAVERLIAYRHNNPEVNVLDFGYYIDGSFRDSVSETGGSACPSQHIWEVGSIFGRTIYICEDIDWGVWRNNHAIDDPERMDLGTYQLAITDPDVVMYRNVGVFIRTIKAADFDTAIDWSIDTIIAVRGLLDSFGDENDMSARTKDFTKRFAHIAAVSI